MAGTALTEQGSGRQTRPPAEAARALCTCLRGDDVSNALDAVVALAARLQRLAPSLLEAGQEVPMDLQQVLQTGKDPFHLHYLPHLVCVHPQHDFQGSNVVNLRLDQLCESMGLLQLSKLSTDTVKDCGFESQGAFFH